MPRPDRAAALAILERRKRVAAGYLAGDTQQEMAAREGINQAQISRDLSAIREEWRQRFAASYDEAQRQRWELTLRELAKLDRIERMALGAWERSCQNEETMHAGRTTGRTDKSGNPIPDLVKSYKTTRGQAGDSRFLAEARNCSDQRCKILGIYAAVKVAGPDGKSLPLFLTLSGLTDEQLDAELEKAEREAAGAPAGEVPPAAAT